MRCFFFHMMIIWNIKIYFEGFFQLGLVSCGNYSIGLHRKSIDWFLSVAGIYWLVFFRSLYVIIVFSYMCLCFFFPKLQKLDVEHPIIYMLLPASYADILFWSSFSLLHLLEVWNQIKKFVTLDQNLPPFHYGQCNFKS